MSYVELIVVLSIFSAMTSVVLFNYGDFQARVDIKNLASDIALKVVEAQKMSLSGDLPPQAQYTLLADPVTWNPSYGVYFAMSDASSFIYFSNVVNPATKLYDTPPNCTQECLEKITITRNNYISGIDRCTGPCDTPVPVTPLSVVFTRPSSRAIFNSNGTPLTGFDYIQISIASPKGTTSRIKIYPSGRIQVN